MIKVAALSIQPGSSIEASWHPGAAASYAPQGKQGLANGLAHGHLSTEGEGGTAEEDAPAAKGRAGLNGSYRI